MPPTYQANTGGSMAYTDEGLKDKIAEMYPEIRRRGILLSLDFSGEENAYIVKLTIR